MVKIFGRGGRLSPKEEIHMRSEEDRLTQEMGDPNYDTMLANAPFDTKVLEDGRLDEFFDLNSPFFHPCYLPLKPWISSRLHLGLLTEKEIEDVWFDLNITEQKCYTLAQSYMDTTDVHYFNIDELVNVIKWLITMRAKRATLLRALTTHRKLVQVEPSGQPKKRGIFG